MDRVQMANGPCKNQGVRGARYTEFEQDSIQDKDTIELAKVGKKQVLKVNCSEPCFNIILITKA